MMGRAKERGLVYHLEILLAQWPCLLLCAPMQKKDVWYSVIFQQCFHLEVGVQNSHAILRQEFMSL